MSGVRLAKEKDMICQAIFPGVGARLGHGGLLGQWGHMTSFKASDSEMTLFP